MRLWKALGLAGLAGVAATGAVIARDRRQRAQLSPEQVRDRLRERLTALAALEGQDADAARPQPGSTESSARP
jgi:hypothetical protein